MASRPCPSCGGHDIQCKCGGVGAQKRKSANPPSQTPASKRAAGTAAAAGPAKGAAEKGAAAKGAPAAKPKMKADEAQRLVLFHTACAVFGNPAYCKYFEKFNSPDGSCARLHMASMSDENVKVLVKGLRCNLFRVKYTGRTCADHKDKPFTVECADEGTPYCYEGYRTLTLYNDMLRPYCFGCGGESRVKRKRGTVQTFSCPGCNMEFTKKMVANVFARLGPLKAKALEQKLSYKEYLRKLVGKSKAVLHYTAPLAAPALASTPAHVADPASPAVASTAPWEWFEKDLPGGGARVNPELLPRRLKAVFQMLRCRDQGKPQERKCCFLFTHAAKQLSMSKELLTRINPDLDVTPKVLFHGCPFDVLPDILMGGFQNAGTANAKVYGQGVYFAENPRYSLQRQYSPCDDNGNRVLLVCPTIVGKMITTNHATTMLPVECRTGGDASRGIYMKPFANVQRDVAIAFAIVWQE